MPGAQFVWNVYREGQPFTSGTGDKLQLAVGDNGRYHVAVNALATGLPAIARPAPARGDAESGARGTKTGRVGSVSTLRIPAFYPARVSAASGRRCGMLTCKSPRKVMRAAHALGCRCLRKYSSKFSRHDYTLPQLFACLAVREQMRLSYRGAEALLRDGRAWCRAIGIRGRKTPDHATLHRAAGVLLTGRRLGRALDVLAEWFTLARALGDTLAVDSTCYDVHHRSRHYELRCRRHNAGGRYDGSGDARRSASVRRTPKLSLGVDTRSHVILSAHARAGMCSDAPSFDGLLFDAWRRRGGRVKTVLADAGYDSEANHRIARHDMGVRSLIRPGVGRRPADASKPPAGRYRRRMKWELAGSQKGKPYGQRAQAETAISMLKRNLGDALRARSPRMRRREHAFKAVVHDLMLARSCRGGSRQSRSGVIDTTPDPRPL